MRLLELEVRDWRGLTTKLGPFSPRLNLILGPNESGKSRLFQALRFGLFESHKGSAQHKQSLQTWASGDSPFVRITFSVQNIEFEIQKRFLKGASSQLAGGGRTVQGEDAEARLRALLGTREVNARGAALTDLGIWPLLMVGQGESRTTLESHMNADGRGRLQDRLAAEVGVVSISSKGRHLKKLASDEYFRYFTQTGQDAKVLKDARGRLDEARESLRTERDHYTRQAMISEDLANKQSVLIGLGERFRSRKAEAEAAQHNAESARQIRNRQRSAETAQQLADQKVQSLKDRLKNRREADEALARLTKEIADLDDRVRLREQDEKRLDGELQNAEVRLRDAEDKRRDIQQALDALRRENRRKDLTEGLETIGERIKTLDQLEREIIAAVRARAALIQVDTTSLERLKGLDGAVRSAAAQLRGSAVSVVLELKETVEIDGVLHAAGERLTFEVTDNQRIRLGTVADVEIRPSSGSLGKLRSEKQDAERALRAALDELSLADVAHAIRAQAQLSEADVKLGQLRASASVLSSRTLAQLREDQSGLEAELHRLGAPPPPWTGPVSSADDLTEAERAVDIARSELDAAISALAEHRKATATLQGEIAAKLHEHQPLLSLDADRLSADVLGEQLKTAESELSASSHELLRISKEYTDLGGESLEEDALRLQNAASALEGRLKETRSQVDQLKGSLQTLMAGGYYESVQQAEASVALCEAEVERIETQAAAAKRLWTVLSEAENRVVERLTGPVIQRVQPYLQDLFPGSTLHAGENLSVEGLRSGNIEEPYEALSGGAQEQISLMTRIGLAEVLAGDGTLPLVLDDALINTDPERIKRIHRLLFRAANKLQIILFSCHDVLFDGLGAEQVMNLERIRGRASS